jgi:hypothetical protein
MDTSDSRALRFALATVALLGGLTAGVTPAFAAGTTDVRVAAGPVPVTAGGTTTAELVVASAGGGVGAYDLRVTLDDDSRARVAAIEAVGSPGSVNASVAPDGASARIAATGVETADDGTVRLARVTVRGVAPGTTTLDIAVRALSDEGGLDYEATGQAATVVVASSPVVVGTQPARDLDGDGLFEDVNGDGRASVSDVQALFAGLDGDAVRSNEPLFDFNADGGASVADVQRLFVDVTGQLPPGADARLVDGESYYRGQVLYRSEGITAGETVRIYEVTPDGRLDRLVDATGADTRAGVRLDTTGYPPDAYALVGSNSLVVARFEVVVQRFSRFRFDDRRVDNDDGRVGLAVDSNRVGYDVDLTATRDGTRVRPADLLEVVTDPDARTVDTDGDSRVDAVRVPGGDRTVPFSLRSQQAGTYVVSGRVADSTANATATVTVRE